MTVWKRFCPKHTQISRAMPQLEQFKEGIRVKDMFGNEGRVTMVRRKMVEYVNDKDVNFYNNYFDLEIIQYDDTDTEHSGS